jgi:hypothetical protein
MKMLVMTTKFIITMSCERIYLRLLISVSMAMTLFMSVVLSMCIIVHIHVYICSLKLLHIFSFLCSFSFVCSCYVIFMFMLTQHVHTAFSCKGSMFLQRRHTVWRHKHKGCACSIDKQHVIWRHGHAAWRHDDAAWTSRIKTNFSKLFLSELTS